MFKLLALRVLEDCADYVKKCLHENTYYYFSTDYRLDDPYKVYKGNRYTEPLQPEFFSPVKDHDKGDKQEQTLTINLNAIVGKNGDGKSSIVELIIRLVNNYIAKHPEKLHSNNIPPLKPVDNVYAELYFQIDEFIYKLSCTKDGKEGVFEIANVSALINNKEQQFFPRYCKQDTRDVFKTIYTLVSNYSHYAYNIFDFSYEWNYEGNDIQDDNVQYREFWLHRIFHKNDGYITPLSIHPYRKSGNIDVNKEAQLSKQRLLYLFVKPGESNSFRNILGKKAVGLRLTPSKNNKLLERSIKAFFLANKDEDTSIDWAIKPIASVVSDLNAIFSKLEITEKDKQNAYAKVDNIYGTYIKGVQYVYDKILGGKDFPDHIQPVYIDFLNNIARLLDESYEYTARNKKRYTYRPQHSSILSYNRVIKRLSTPLRKMGEMRNILPHPAELYGNGFYVFYNLSQLSRLYTIFTLALRFEIDPKILFANYDDLTNKEKARLYKIYKVLSIFETYPQYTQFLRKKDKNWGAETCFEYSKRELSDLFKQLFHDENEGSHITKKLVQIENYLNIKADIFDEPDFVIDYKPKDPASRIKNITCVEHYYGAENVDPFHLVPPIFDYDIVLQEGNSFMEYGFLSSGEKQLLNNIGAIIYHLQNIDSADSKYQSVNIILEEIELYFHPEFQRLLINSLFEQIFGITWKNIKNINMTFVTHSPFVLSDIPKCNVLFLDNGKPDYSMQENTFGANIHSLLKNGFFLPNLPIGEFAYQKINDLFRRLNDHQYKDDEIEQIKQEIALIGEPYLREQLYRLIPYYNRNVVH